MTSPIDFYLLFQNDFIGFKQFITVGSAAANFTFPEPMIKEFYVRLIQFYWIKMLNYGLGIAKAAGYPIGVLLQVLALVYLVRGNSGYSPSSRKWFLVVVGADLASGVYRIYEIITVDFQSAYPRAEWGPGVTLSNLMWGLRSRDHVQLQFIMCRLFFIVIYFPVYLSPIALTTSSIVRCYCVKYPATAKAKLTVQTERNLILLVSALALVVSGVIGGLMVEGWSSTRQVVDLEITGGPVYIGNCRVPDYSGINSDKVDILTGFHFMLVVAFIICFFNTVASAIILSMQAQLKRSVTASSSGVEAERFQAAEIRATIRQLGMSLTLIVCFFLSRLLLVIGARMDYMESPIAFVVVERTAVFLFHIPYFTNTVFIAGLSKDFYKLRYLWAKKYRSEISMATELA